MYREYVRQSWIKPIFWNSLIFVLVTGVTLMMGKVVGEAGGVADAVPGLRNLTLIAIFAFIMNIVLAGFLFSRAIMFARPEQWRTMRRNVNERDVREAVQDLLALDTTSVSPHPREGSADGAIQSLLNEALRAMAERQQAAFAQSLESIKELVTYAMGELEGEGIQWSPPGSQAHWPPLRELVSNLYSFREEVIREGNRDYVAGLWNLDCWLARTGVRQHCGEMFTVGLDGYLRNYQIANRNSSGEFREMVRDRFSLNVYGLIFGAVPDTAFPYAREMVRHQERLLSAAMHTGRADDYERLHQGFEGQLQLIKWAWQREDTQTEELAGLFEALEQDYRVSLMGLAGRAVMLAESGSIANASPYLDVSRKTHIGPETLAGDVAQALSRDDRSGFSLWDEWEEEGWGPVQAHMVFTERYPLTYFAVRLMELCPGRTVTLNLCGTAQRVLDWFVNNSDRLEIHALDDPTATKEQRRESATHAMREAVLRDTIEEDYEIIKREISAARVSDFTSDVYAAAFGANLVERLFDQAGAFLYLPSHATDGPEKRGFFGRLLPKAFLTESPRYLPLDGSPWGRGLSDDVVGQLCKVLDNAPETTTSLATSLEMLQATDQAVEALGPSAEIIVVLAGDWGSAEVDLAFENPEGYEPAWRLPEADQVELIGTYQTHPILRGPSPGERRLYVVEPGGWGSFVRAQVEGDRDLSVEINPVSAGRAQELLEGDPRHFADEPGQESKLRKLQTCVEMAVSARTGFCVIDASRSRRITGVH